MIIRIFLSAAILAFSALPVFAFDISNMSQSDRDTLGTEIRTYILQNPQVIIEALSILEARETQSQKQNDLELVAQNHKAIFDDGYSFVGGNPNGNITIVEFLDYRCGYCRRAFEAVTTLLEQDKDIRFIIKEFPILGEASMQGSQFAIAIKQLYGGEAYDKVHHIMMGMNAQINETSLTRLAQQLDLDAKKIFDHMGTNSVLSEIQNTHALAQKLKITGTPTFVIQDELFRGFIPLESLNQIIAQKRN